MPSRPQCSRLMACCTICSSVLIARFSRDTGCSHSEAVNFAGSNMLVSPTQARSSTSVHACMFARRGSVGCQS